MTLGDLPHGFLETHEGCSDVEPAFIRGVLLGKPDYLRMTPQQQMALERPPRWTLYIGPISDRFRALSWDSMMFIWAAQNNLVWIPLGTPCIVRNSRVRWQHDEPRWHWVYEYDWPRSVVRRWTGDKYVYEYESGGLAAST